MRKFLLIIVSCIYVFLASPAEGKKIRQRLKADSSKSNSSNTTESESKSSHGSISREWIRGDSLEAFKPSTIRFAGYDKQANSHRESFHIINESTFNLRKMEFYIIYKDMQGRMLHKRKMDMACFVPAGETRLMNIPTWDNQYSFYYFRSNPPRKIATPYQVEIVPIHFWLTL